LGFRVEDDPAEEVLRAQRLGVVAGGRHLRVEGLGFRV
jgi:hypothetical protein